MNRLTRWMAIGLLGMVSTVALANSLRVVRESEGPVSVVVNRDDERTELTLDPDNPDWAALDAAFGDAPEAERWRSMIESVLKGDGPLSLALDHNGGVRTVFLPHIEMVMETEEMEAKMEEVHARLAEETARIEAETARIEAHMAEMVIPTIVVRHKAEAAKAITRMIEEGEFSAEQLEAMRSALAGKTPTQ
ncbi:hypothetical protein KUV89_05660 [Marinobacter hydrocarbonoclasticus]|nr:hypothetical protein [Marinobacter nauticus]